MSTTTTKPKEAAASPNMLLALMAVDWLRGDRLHQAAIRKQAMALLESLGDEGAEAKASLEGTGV
jgi:hypothetical protein